eukprot:1158653-Pelagomonas_calceolata.AAC.5
MQSRWLYDCLHGDNLGRVRSVRLGKVPCDRYLKWPIMNPSQGLRWKTWQLQASVSEEAKFQNNQLGRNCAKSMQKTPDFRPQIAPSGKNATNKIIVQLPLIRNAMPTSYTPLWYAV